MRIERRDGKTFVRDEAEGWLEVKYGLPPNVEYCRLCVTSNQRVAPSVVVGDRRDSHKDTVHFEDGICEACRVVAAKASIDWEKRERDLRQLLDRFRSRNGGYDCLVPGSGGKDSAFAAHLLKTRYGMNPLTVTWAPHLYTEVGWRNFQNWIHVGGFDNYLLTPDGVAHRKLTALAFRNLLHPFQPFVLGQRHYPPKMAMRMGIPLVFYGENAAEYGVTKGEDAASQMPTRYYTGDPQGEMFLGGVPIDDLRGHGIPRSKLEPYLPPTMAEIEKAGVQVHYLGYFVKWIPQECYYYAVEHTGFEPNTERTEGTYSKYNSIDDRVDGFHYWCAHVKFGIGRCTHEASQEVRHGHIDRDEAVALVRRFDGELPRRYLGEFLDYVSLPDEAEFLAIADTFRSPHLWRRTPEGWRLRHPVT